MRSDYSREATSVLTWIISALLAGFILQNVFGRWLGSSAFESLAALTPGNFRQGYVWTLLSYPVLHASIFHLLVNGLGIFLLGRELVPLVGPRAFLAVFLAAAALGGLVWLAVHAFTGGSALVGASGCTLALFILFACFFPDREITFLLFFVLPVTVKPKYLAWVLVGVDLLGLLFGELPGGTYDTGIAYSAHLGGILTGWIYFRYFHANNGWDRASGFSWPAWLGRRPKTSPAAPPGNKPRGKAAPDLRAEVDRILDKINSHGFGALTAEEKRILDDAKDMLSRP